MVKILNIDHGFIDDDVFKNRVTLTVKTDRDAVITCRLYQSGSIFGIAANPGMAHGVNTHWRRFQERNFKMDRCTSKFITYKTNILIPVNGNIIRMIK